MPSVQETKKALDRAVKVVTKSPSRGQRINKNVATIAAGTFCRMKEKDHVLTADVSQSMGGENLAPSPGVMLRSALTGCVAIGIKMWAARMDIPVTFVKVTLEADVDAQGQLGIDEKVAPGFEELRLEIIVQSPSDKCDVNKMINKSLKYSHVLDAFMNPNIIKTAVIIENSDETNPMEVANG